MDVEVLPPEMQQKAADAFERISKDVTETVEPRPASLVVVRTGLDSALRAVSRCSGGVVAHRGDPRLDCNVSFGSVDGQTFSGSSCR